MSQDYLSPQHPEICTSTGELPLLSKSLFKINNETEKAKVIAKLKENDDLEQQEAVNSNRFTWHGDRDKNNRLSNC